MRDDLARHGLRGVRDRRILTAHRQRAGERVDANRPRARFARASNPRPEIDAGHIYHSNRGSQYVSIRYTERIATAGSEVPVGSRGSAYNDPLAESLIGRYAAEVNRDAGPWRTLDDVDYATLDSVASFTNCRLREPLGNHLPAEYETQYAALQTVPHAVAALS
jgi:transposase InsO family protein